MPKVHEKVVAIILINLVLVLVLVLVETRLLPRLIATNTSTIVIVVAVFVVVVAVGVAVALAPTAAAAVRAVFMMIVTTKINTTLTQRATTIVTKTSKQTGLVVTSCHSIPKHPLTALTTQR